MKERDIKQMYRERFVLREAIYEVKGVDVPKARGRKLEVVISKMIYCYECERIGYKRKEIAEQLNTSVGSVGYYIRKYSDELKYDRRFARLVRKVDEAKQRITDKLNFNHKKINLKMGKSKRNKHRSFYLSEKTQEKLDKICEKHQINYSAAMSLLINEYELQ